MRTILVLILLLPLARGQDCGTIDRTNDDLRIGAAASRGEITIEPCGGAGRPEPPRARAPLHPLPEFTAEWARMNGGSGARQSTATTQTLPGGNYEYDRYLIPAGVVITYTDAVRIYAEHVEIHGSVGTNSPGASIRIEATRSFLIEGEADKSAGIVTLGEDSPIEIGAQEGITGRYRSEIYARYGDILISSGDTAGLPVVDLESTDVRARDGAVRISSVNDLDIDEGFIEGNGGGVVLRSRGGGIQITDAVIGAGSEGGGLDFYAGSIVMEGRCDLYAGSGPIEMNARAGEIWFTDVYSVYTHTGDQVYRASGVRVTGNTYLFSSGGDITIEATDMSWLTGTSQVSSTDGDVHLLSHGLVHLRDDFLFASTQGRTRLDVSSLDFEDRVQIGEDGPLEIRCDSLYTDLAGPLCRIQGSTVDVHVKSYTADLGQSLLRAETGDLVIRSGGRIESTGTFEAHGDIRLDAESRLELGGATLRTDDRTDGTSGSIHLRSWGGAEGHVSIADATVRTGDADMALGTSGDIEVFVGTLFAEEMTTSYILPKRVRLKIDGKDPTHSRVTVSGICDLGLDAADLTTAVGLAVGGLDLALPGLLPKAGGRKFSHRDAEVKLAIKPSRHGTSRATFRLTLTADFTGKVDPDGELKLGLGGSGLDSVGTVQLSGGRFVLGKAGAAPVDPGFYVAKAGAKIKGAGKDRLALVLGLVREGPAPTEPNDFHLLFGEGVDVTIPAASFAASGDRHRFRGNIDGITSVAIDYAKGTVKVRGRNLDLGPVPEGAVEMSVAASLGDDARAAQIRMARRGARLRY